MSIRTVDETLTGTTTSGSHAKEDVLSIIQSFRTGLSPSDFLVSYQVTRLERGFTSQSIGQRILKPQLTWLA